LPFGRSASNVVLAIEVVSAAFVSHSEFAVIQLKDTTRVIPFYRPVPLTSIPLLYNAEHLFPYTSYGETSATPVPRAFQMVVLENDFLRVEVAPELGGRVQLV
jgi:hypothetical protein